jgi:hypothetical protein
MTPIDMHQLLGKDQERRNQLIATTHLTSPHALKLKEAKLSLAKITKSIGTAQLRPGACIACIIKEPERV